MQQDRERVRGPTSLVHPRPPSPCLAHTNGRCLWQALREAEEALTAGRAAMGGLADQQEVLDKVDMVADSQE